MRNTAYFLIVATITVLTLIYAQGLIIPFVFAFLFWFVTREFRKLLERAAFVRKYLPGWVRNGVVFILMVLGVGFIADVLTNSITSLSASYPAYEPNVQSIMQKIEGIFHVNLKNSIESAIGDFDFGTALGSILSGLSGVLGNTFMIIIYALFIFLEERSFQDKLTKVIPDQGRYQQFMHTLGKIEVSVFDYLRLKTIVSVMTGTLSYLVLWLVGIDAPAFWAFLIFVLNYIPTIGSLVATVFPAIFSLLQFGEFTPFLIIMVAVGLVQVLVGNVLEPRIMGKSLNLSPLVTIIALAVWGEIWGITGMVLCVPITVIMVIVFSQFEQTKPIAMMLSEDGDIDTER